MRGRCLRAAARRLPRKLSATRRRFAGTRAAFTLFGPGLWPNRLEKSPLVRRPDHHAARYHEAGCLGWRGIARGSGAGVIDFYTWTTPNGRKVSIMLEECRLAYRVHVVNLETGEQRTPAFLKLSPNGRIPAIVDRPRFGRPVALFESGAILIHLAEKTGKFLPRGRRRRARVLQWVMWQVGGVGPALGQLRHFTDVAPEPSPYAIGRFRAEALRLLGVLDRNLSESEFVAGEYSIADMMLFPWIARARDMQPEVLEGAEHVLRWMKKVGARRAVRRGMAVPELSRLANAPAPRASLADSL